MNRLRTAVVAGVALVMAVSCGPKPGLDMSQVIRQETELAGRGKVDKALAHLERYYRSAAYEPSRGALLSALMRIELTAGRTEAGKARFLKAAAEVPELAKQYLRTLLMQREWTAAELVLSAVEAKQETLPGWRGAAAEARIDLILGRDGYKSAMRHLGTVLKALPDEAGARKIRMIGEAAFAARDAAAEELFYETAMAGAPANAPGMRQAAARGWMKTAGRRGDAPEMVARLERFLKERLPPAFVMSQVNSYYSAFLNSGKRDTFKRFYEVLGQLEGSELASGERAQLGGMMLDVTYFLDDFETSLKLIEKGAVTIQEDQKAQMIAKIKAHIEIKNGRPREAVPYLREFMAAIAKSDRIEWDPVRNVRVSSRMILGLNAKRIGDLLTQAGDGDEARKAYAEAREYYGKALQEFPDGKSPENRKIVQEMSEIPAG